MIEIPKSKFIIVDFQSIPHLFTEPGKVSFYCSDQAAIDDLYELNLRVNLIPYTDSDILLQKNYQSTDHTEFCAIIPNFRLEIPNYQLDESPFKTVEKFKQICTNNAFMGLVQYQDRDFYSNIDYAFHYGDLNISEFEAAFNRQGVHLPKSPKFEFGAVFDCDREYGKDRNFPKYAEIYVCIKIDYAQIDAEFIYVPMDVFSQYVESDNPEAYLPTLGIWYTDYDEYGPDFRTNIVARTRIRDAIRLIRANELV